MHDYRQCMHEKLADSLTFAGDSVQVACAGGMGCCIVFRHMADPQTPLRVSASLSGVRRRNANCLGGDYVIPFYRQRRNGLKRSRAAALPFVSGQCPTLESKREPPNR